MPKKNFKDDNPAIQFLSTSLEADKEETDREPLVTDIPNGYKRNPLYIEKKSKRVQLLLQPSLYDRVKQMAVKRGVSVNELIGQILDHATKAAD